MSHGNARDGAVNHSTHEVNLEASNAQLVSLVGEASGVASLDGSGRSALDAVVALGLGRVGHTGTGKAPVAVCTRFHLLGVHGGNDCEIGSRASGSPDRGPGSFDGSPNHSGTSFTCEAVGTIREVQAVTVAGIPLRLTGGPYPPYTANTGMRTRQAQCEIVCIVQEALTDSHARHGLEPAVVGHRAVGRIFCPRYSGECCDDCNEGTPHDDGSGIDREQVN